jgi:hypothetical protein
MGFESLELKPSFGVMEQHWRAKTTSKAHPCSIIAINRFWVYRVVT